MSVIAVLMGVLFGAVLGRVRTLPLVAQVIVGSASVVALILLARGLGSEHSSTWALGLVAFVVANLATSLSQWRHGAPAENR